jgi:cytochrome c oxidase cbb3-type subunit 3
MKKTKLINLILLLITFFTYSDSFAAEDDSMGGIKIFNYVALGALVLILLSAMVYAINSESHLEESTEPAKASALSKLIQSLTRSTPIEKERDIMLDHDYDGIKELNNSVPPWLNYIFIGSLVFGIFYLLHFHVLGTGKSQFDEYNDEMVVARMDMERLMQSGAFITEENVVALDDESSLTAGKERFAKDCSPCHGMNGEGGIGPNMTDNYWIHGGKVSDLFRTVKNGVPEKGMVAWGQQLNPKQMQEVVSFILTLQGTNPPNGKAPEGNLYVPEEKNDSTSTGNDSTQINPDSVKSK